MRTLGLYTAYAGGAVSIFAILYGLCLWVAHLTGLPPAFDITLTILLFSSVAGLALTIIGACLYIAGWKGR